MCMRRTDTTHLVESPTTCIRRGVVEKGAEGGQKTTGLGAVQEGEENSGDNLPARYRGILQLDVNNGLPVAPSPKQSKTTPQSMVLSEGL